jgi:hypothetical protein
MNTQELLGIKGISEQTANKLHEAGRCLPVSGARLEATLYCLLTVRMFDATLQLGNLYPWASVLPLSSTTSGMKL